MRRSVIAHLALALALGAGAGGPARAGAATEVSAAELDAALAAVHAAAPGEARVAAAEKVIGLGRGATAALTARLGAARSSTDEERREVLARFGADVPTPDGKFQPPPRLKKGEKPPPEPNWLAELAAMPEATPAVKESLETVVLVRALAATKEYAAADVILDFAFSEGGVTFRDECGRQLRGMSPYSLPTLLRASQDKQRDKGSYGRYAAYQLEKMDKARPSYALDAAPDTSVEIEILRALGQVKHPDAVPAVLDRCDARAPGVRTAAREAFLLYVTGPPPPPAPKKKRKMAGGKMSDEEMPLYLTYRELAVLELKRRLEELGAPIEKKAKAEALTLQLFELWDQRRVALFNESMDAAAALVKEGKLAEATARYDEILVAEPLLPRRTEMSPAFVARGRELAAEGKWADAVVAFEKGYALDPAGPVSAEARAELHFARAQVLRAAGHPADDELELALAANPEHAEAQAQLKSEQQQAAGGAEKRGWMLWAGAGGAGVTLLLALLAVGARRRAARAV